jgi:hypothetical protein
VKEGVSRNLTEDEVAAVALFLSGERLATFHAFAGTTRDAINLHQQMLHLASSLMGVTAVVEIALRNSICDRLSEHFQVAGWLLRPPVPFQWHESERVKINQAVRSAQRAAYAKKNQDDKRALDATAFPNGVPAAISHDDRSNARQRAITVATGQVIAQLTMFFWKRLYSDDYEQALWRTALKRVFPDKSLKRAVIAAQLERIYQTRNRTAHHEPVYGRRLADTLTAIDFVVNKFGTPDAGGVTPIGKLLQEDLLAVKQEAAALEAKLTEFRTGGLPP